MTDDIGVQVKALSASRLKSIDLLRGVAALGVVFAHAFTRFEYPPTAPHWMRILGVQAHWGSVGVALFFVISGFCIHLRWAKQYATSGQTNLDFAVFWKRRIFRLYPPYFVALCLAMTMVVLAYHSHMDVASLRAYPQPHSRWIAMDFVAHVFMLHGFYPVFDTGGGNGVFWTLAREEYFYLLYIPLLASRKRWGLLKSLAGVLVLGIVFQVVMDSIVPASSPWRRFTIDNSCLVLWVQWCLGMVAVEAYYGIIKLPRWCSQFPLAALSVVVAGWCDFHCALLSPAAWGVSFFVLMNYLVTLEQAGRWSSNILTNLLCRVGLFSYSLYLVHGLSRHLLERFAGTPDPVLHPGSCILSSVLNFFTGCLAGLLFFMLVERHFLNRPAGGVKAPGRNGSASPVGNGRAGCVVETA